VFSGINGVCRVVGMLKTIKRMDELTWRPMLPCTPPTIGILKGRQRRQEEKASDGEIDSREQTSGFRGEESNILFD
ncbi:hypothetical protein Dimus_033021, partial [Dionaea muscipula]